MAKVTGVGGVFFKSKGDSRALARGAGTERYAATACGSCIRVARRLAN